MKKYGILTKSIDGLHFVAKFSNGDVQCCEIPEGEDLTPYMRNLFKECGVIQIKPGTYRVTKELEVTKSAQMIIGSD